MDEFEKIRNKAGLDMGRIARYQGRDNDEWREAARNFAFAKTMITLTKLAAEYPPMSNAQKREVRKLLAA